MGETLLPDPAVLNLESIAATSDTITIVVTARPDQVPCPCCGRLASRIHSHYRRTVAGLPWRGVTGRFRITCRKFFCDNRDCQQRIFTERVPTVVARYARKTVRLDAALRELICLVGAEAAARIAKQFGLLVCPATLLRRLRQIPDKENTAPHVVGIDDVAFKGGRQNGTILIDQERRCSIDLLPEFVNTFFVHQKLG